MLDRSSIKKCEVIKLVAKLKKKIKINIYKKNGNEKMF